MAAGSFSTGSTVCQSPPSTSPSNFWKKQECLPVWHAMLSICVTLSSTTSSSQSRRISWTFCTCPDSSPLCHNRLRDRDQNTASPISTVRCSASRFMYANISTSLEPTYRTGQCQVETALGAIAVHACQQQFSCATSRHFLGPFHGVKAGPLAPAMREDLPPSRFIRTRTSFGVDRNDDALRAVFCGRIGH